MSSEQDKQSESRMKEASWCTLGARRIKNGEKAETTGFCQDLLADGNPQCGLGTHAQHCGNGQQREARLAHPYQSLL